jgi:hypothetical protein
MARKSGGELPQGLIQHLRRVSADGLWVPRFRGQETEHGVLMDSVAPHGCCLPMMYGPGLKHQERENALHIGG